MAVRNETPLNELVLAVIVALKGISAKKNAAYLTSPASVERLNYFGTLTASQKPLLRVSMVSGEFDPLAAQRLEGNITLGVHCMTENKGDAEGELLRLVSDVILALAVDVTLGGKAVYLFPRSFEPNVDLTQRTGLAVTTVNYDLRYKFDSIAP